MRDELAGPSAAPSYAEVQRRLALKDKLIGSERAVGTVESVDEELDSLAVRLDDIRAQLSALGDAADSPEDTATVAEFKNNAAKFISELSIDQLELLYLRLSSSIDSPV